MKIRAGLGAAALVALSMVAPAHADTTAPTAPTVEPALVQQLETVWLNGHHDAWIRDGGTFTDTWDRPGDPYLSHTHTKVVLDAIMGRSSQELFQTDRLPSHDVFIGRTRYHHTAPQIRTALHKHHAPVSSWTSSRMSAHGAKKNYPASVSGINYVASPTTVDVEWQSLSVTTDAQGNKTYTGSYREEIGSSQATAGAPVVHYYYTPQVVVHADAQNRPLSWDVSGPFQAVGFWEHDSVATDHQAWSWSRPHVSPLKTHNTARPAVRAEKQAWKDADALAGNGNDLALRTGRPLTVDKLQHVHGVGRLPVTRIAKGLKLREHAAGHTYTWKIVVRDGKALIFPVSN